MAFDFQNNIDINDNNVIDNTLISFKKRVHATLCFVFNNITYQHFNTHVIPKFLLKMNFDVENKNFDINTSPNYVEEIKYCYLQDVRQGRIFVQALWYFSDVNYLFKSFSLIQWLTRGKFSEDVYVKDHLHSIKITGYDDTIYPNDADYIWDFEYFKKLKLITFENIKMPNDTSLLFYLHNQIRRSLIINITNCNINIDTYDAYPFYNLWKFKKSNVAFISHDSLKFQYNKEEGEQSNIKKEPKIDKHSKIFI